MKKIVVLVLLAMLVSSVAQAEKIAYEPLGTLLSGAAEISLEGAPNAGDPDGAGSAFVSLDARNAEICFDITATNITLPVTLAHIHEAPAGQNGGVVVDFLPGGATDEDGIIQGCVPAAPTLITEIAAAPADYYVNIHNDEFGGGAVRGQLALALATTLSGRVEVNAEGELNQGDPDGTGTAGVTFDAAAGQICYDIAVANVALPITLAHIHEAPAGENGGVVVDFLPGATDADGVFAGCVTAEAALITEILTTPADYYVNIHNGEFPGGVVRGQLGEAVALEVSLSGEQEIDSMGMPDAGDLDGTGIANLSLDAADSEICFDITVRGIAFPVTLAHIHEAPVGENGGVVVDFLPGGATDDDGMFAGCVVADASVVSEILATPENYYVNIHNGEFPGGAVRGQLNDGVQLIVNGGFELDSEPNKQPDLWKLRQRSGDKIKTNKTDKTFAYAGNNAVVFKGSADESASLRQKVKFATEAETAAGSILSFSAQAEAKNLRGKAKVKVEVRYFDNTLGRGKLKAKVVAGTYGYELITSDPLELAGPVKKITVDIINKSRGGKINLDEVKLLLDAPMAPVTVAPVVDTAAVNTEHLHHNH